VPDGRDKKTGRFAKGNRLGALFQPGNEGGASSYHQGMDEAARRFCLLTNATDDMLAEFLGIGLSTLHWWKKEHPTFGAAIRAGKEEADMTVAEAAGFAAIGGLIREQQAIKIKVKDPDTGKVVERVEVVWVERYVPPNVQAQRLWLINRSRHWKPEGEQPDAKPSTVVNNITNNTTVIVAKVHDELSEIFGDALSGAASDRPPRVN
jgi:hypothetical protein